MAYDYRSKKRISAAVKAAERNSKGTGFGDPVPNPLPIRIALVAQPKSNIAAKSEGVVREYSFREEALVDSDVEIPVYNQSSSTLSSTKIYIFLWVAGEWMPVWEDCVS